MIALVPERSRETELTLVVKDKRSEANITLRKPSSPAKDKAFASQGLRELSLGNPVDGVSAVRHVSPHLHPSA